eukprot:TRINITY_DN6442_c0_g1_i2.p1 TRINITY_DN6442_c0_g1~~TRINITY_DN6442_c0_g1_i2.p1  ORF type:complete len:116 (+),score=24.21 TRINITY_DN6442_c0_g1_i2:51-350(+)
MNEKDAKEEQQPIGGGSTVKMDEHIASLVPLIKKTVPRVLASNVLVFLRDILVVLLGMRCSVLIEYALPDFSDFVHLFNTWKTKTEHFLSNVVLYRIAV